jgi:hypothetical protein
MRQTHGLRGVEAVKQDQRNACPESGCQVCHQSGDVEQRRDGQN